MTADGGAKLRKAFEAAKQVRIQKMIVAISPSGPFLQRFASFVDLVWFGSYREAAFQVPDGNTISEIIIGYAPEMRAFIAGSNTHLESLEISKCLLDRVPQTLPKMTKLKKLSITQCKITVLRLDMLANNQNLKTLELSSNQIQQLLPATGRPARMLSIETLTLTGNLLQNLDMTLFVAMPQLLNLYVLKNLIVSLDVSTPIALPNLSGLYLGYNKIVSLDLRNLTLPKLETLSCGPNALTRMPILPRPLPKLNYLSLSANNLTQLDMSYFRPYPTLQMIVATSNQITTVRASSPVRLPVDYLGLNDNKITTFNITGWDMPNITMLNLDGNQLSVVPSVFERYPKVYLFMNRNPLLCDALLPFKDRLKNYQLQKDPWPLSKACTTTSSFTVDETFKICCDK
uniref:Uncharacterized protein n=1 Tax=Anopheles quadriannulatus TaxID=34691 RepID=A0A1I8JW11_ANOQN